MKEEYRVLRNFWSAGGVLCRVGDIIELKRGDARLLMADDKVEKVVKKPHKATKMAR